MKSRKRVFLNLVPTDKKGVYLNSPIEGYSTPEILFDDDSLPDLNIKDLIEDDELRFRDYGDYTQELSFQSTMEQKIAREANEKHVRNVAIAHDTVTIDLSEKKEPEKRTFKTWLKSMIPSKRRLVQLYTALLFNANLKGYIQGDMFVGKSKFVCSPGINCYSCPGAVGACPLGSLQNELGNHHFPFYIFGILFLYGLMFGRMICGWFCPFGLVQDLLHKIKTPKLKKSAITRALSYLKYIILVLFVFIFAGFGIFPAFCKYICPAGLLEAGFGLLPTSNDLLNMLGPLFTWKFVLFVSCVVICIFAYRAFCRFICPLGAIYSLFNKISFFGIKLNKDKCTHCGKCINKCKLDIKHVGDHECISCGECIDVCPTKAISWKGPKIFVAPNEIEVPAGADEETIALAEKKQQEENEKARKKNKRTKIIIASIMATVLASVLVYFNIIDNDKLWDKDNNPPATDTNTDEGKPPVGTEVGKSLPSHSLEKFDETGLLGENIDPSKTGKVTVINFWGTWCPSCIAELPYFDNVAAQYKDEVVFVAVHSEDKFATEASAYVNEHFKDSAITFVKDTRPSGATSDTYYSLIGGKFNIYPYTVIIDANGVITYTKFAEISTNHDEIEGILTTEIEKALNK